MNAFRPLLPPAARRWLPLSLVAGAALLAACGGEYPQSTLHPTGNLGVSIDELQRTIFWWAVGVFVVVECALLFVILRYRERPEAPRPPHVHGSTVLEIAWTLAPAVVLVFVAVPTIQTIFRTQTAPPDDAVRIEVVGHQWWWEYRYPDLGIVTANELSIPVGRPVVLSLTSADVIHSYWAPKLAGKRDVIPNRTNHLVFAAESLGVHLGQCAEFCGESHANMRLRVVVHDSAGFAGWVARQQATPAPLDRADSLVRAGAAAFRRVRDPANHSCIACHVIEGVSGGLLGPNLTHVASRETIAAGILLNTPDGLARWLRDAPREKPGSLMPKIALTDDEIAALVAYLQHLR